MTKRQQFYKSHRWETFVKRLRIERVNQDGLLLCEYCGKPILKAYDCIGHHQTELTEENVEDVTVSLNPDNVMLIHFRCHNEIHKRFGFQEKGGFRQPKQVFLVWGSPCSGKTTWVNSVAEKSDIVLDIDRIWTAVKASCCDEHEKPNELKTNVFALRDCMLDMIKTRRGNWQNAYVIGGYPFNTERERTIDLLGARPIFIDTEKKVCLERAKLKDNRWNEYIEIWWDRYSPGSD